MYRFAALLLSLAFAAAPTAADYCAAVCEASHIHGAAAAPAHAGHHHPSPAPLSTIGHAPLPCGHDHQAIVGIAAPDNGARVHALAHASIVLVPASLDASSPSIPRHEIAGSNSPPGTSLSLASPLRI